MTQLSQMKILRILQIDLVVNLTPKVVESRVAKRMAG